ncbi:hypothetical protein TIFTF001_022512 [Ficus carica]|uniref:Uncharacterized protein n=1 Tax=Ficus carica TaxID=3494 RepID=A0AA88AIS7_FICCA|nr:hypothetical protein TIFTF001_022512 [Ficus carica]
MVRGWGRCGKEQGMNEIIGGGAWLSRSGEVLQQLGFDNLVSHDDVVRFIANDYFCVNEVVSPPFELVVYLSNLSLDGVLIPLKLLLCGVSSGPCATES